MADEIAVGDEVFISYKSERRRAAEHLAEILRRNGYSVWFDYSLIKGRDFGLQLDERIRAARALIVLWCGQSVNSRWVHEEVDLAVELGILVPVKIEPCDLRVGSRRAEYIDLIDWDAAPRSHSLDPLFDALEAKLGRGPLPDVKELRRYEELWRRFGAPRLAQFALLPALRDPVREVAVGRVTAAPASRPAAPIERKPAPLSQFRDRLSDGSEGPEMVVIPAGEFLMGSPMTERNRFNREGPQQRVRIRAFALGRFAVTVTQFQRFAAAAQHRTDGENHEGSNWRMPGFVQGPDHPVVCISFRDAIAYTQWLSEQTRHRYRLPSEAEWEYAARAGTTTAYSTGDTLSSRQANFDREHRGTRSVGSYPANPFGLHEVYGNVWEWVRDCWHANYEGAPSDGRPWLAENGGDCSRRVLRGGSWIDYPRDLRSANRFRGRDDVADFLIGFRLARTL